MVWGGGVHLGRTAYIIHHISAKKEYSDLIQKVNQSGKHKLWSSDLASLPQGAWGGREGTVLVPPGKGHRGRRSSQPSSSQLSTSGGEGKVFSMFVHQHSIPFSARGKGSLAHSVWELYGALRYNTASFIIAYCPIFPIPAVLSVHNSMLYNSDIAVFCNMLLPVYISEYILKTIGSSL